MKKAFFISFLFLLVSISLRGQDTLYFKNGNKQAVTLHDVNMRRVIYRDFPQTKGRMQGISSRHIKKIVYRSGGFISFEKPKPFKTIPYKTLMETKFDSSFVKKNFARLYLTDLYLNKLSIGFEHLLNKNYSIDLDAHYRFSLGKNGPNVLSNYSNYYYVLSQGYEIKVGVSRHYHLKRNRASIGAAISYGQQGFSKQSFTAAVSLIPSGYYNLTHERKAIGTFLKLNYQFTPQQSGFEFFISPGIYFASTKNTYHSYTKGQPGTYTEDPSLIPKFTSWKMKDGFALFPCFNFGISYIIKQPQKGWYSLLERKRDSLRIHGKNTFLFNVTELIENAIGLTYWRMSYKHSFSYYTSLAIGLNNSLGPGISNAFLQEKSLNYSLLNKEFDVLLGLNYNLSRRQRSFPFLGVSCRMAQFEGRAYKEAFLLNKYYLNMNAGWMIRNDKGVSFLFNLGPGHYFNQYLSPDPHFHGPFSGINTFYASIQMGYSF